MANDFSQRSDCIALWDFESGALTADSKGTCTLTAVNNPTADAVNYQQGAAALLLAAASSQYMKLIDSDCVAKGFPLNSGDTKKQICVAGWFRPTTVDTNKRRIWGKWKSSGNQRSLELYHNSSQIYFQWSSDGTSGNSHEVSLGFGAMTANQWYHITFRLDGVNNCWAVIIYNLTAGTWYRNQGTLSANLFVGNADWRIGQDDDLTANQYFDGDIDEMVVFNNYGLHNSESLAIEGGSFPAANIYDWLIDGTGGADANDGFTQWSKAWKRLATKNFAAGDIILGLKSTETQPGNLATATVTAGAYPTLTLQTTQDLTGSLAQYSFIRLTSGGVKDNTIYMIAAINSTTITLNRPYRGTAESGKSIYLVTAISAASNDWAASSQGAIQAWPITLKGGINSSTWAQDGFTVLSAASGGSGYGVTIYSYWNISNFGTYYWGYGWPINSGFTYGGSMTNCFSFRQGTTTGNSLVGWTLTNLVSEGGGNWFNNQNMLYNMINGFEGGTSGYRGLNINGTWVGNTVINFKNAGYASYAAIYLLNIVLLLNNRFINPLFDEMNSGCNQIDTYGNSELTPDGLVFINPSIGNKPLGVGWSGFTTYMSGEISFENIGGNYQDCRKVIFPANADQTNFWIQRRDDSIYNAAAPSSKLSAYKAMGLLPMVRKFTFPCDAGIAKTVSAYLRKNSAPISTVTINAGGSGYAVNDLISVTQTNAGASVLQVTSIGGGGAVTGVSVLEGGFLYSVANTLATTALTGSGTGCKINITAIGIGYGSLFRPFMRVRWVTGTAPNLVENYHDVTMPDTNDSFVQVSYAVTPSVNGGIIVELWFYAINTGTMCWYDDVTIQ